jgi:hypothetical protein
VKVALHAQHAVVLDAIESVSERWGDNAHDNSNVFL